MPAMAQSPIHLTILRKGDTHIVDLAEVGSLIPRSETQVDGAFLQELTAEVMHLATPGYGRGDGVDVPGTFSLSEPGTVVQDLQRIGGLIFSHLLTEPARKRLRTAEPCDLYLRLDEHLIHIPWELCYDGHDFLATKFRLGRQVITGSPIPGIAAEREVKDSLKVLLVADPTESLPAASHEADLLCTLLDGVAKVDVTLMGGKQVRKIPLLAALQAHDIVHFAGHSHYDPENPSKSGWRLREGVLTAGELSKLNCPPLLVFSNSCQAGATAEWKSGYQYEGQAFGIGSAFLLAGVQNYIGTFWVVYDDESVLFATTFYQGVVSGLSLGEALFKARHEVLKQRGWQGLTWASYMLYGDPTFTLLPGVEGQSQSVLPSSFQETIRKKPLSLETEEPGLSEPSHLRTPVRSLRQVPVRRLLLISGMAAGVLLPMSFFFHQHVPMPPQVETQERKSIDSPQLSASLQKSSSPSPQEKRQPKAVGVMHFKALRIDPQLEWMRDAIRDSFNSQLSSAADLKVYSKEYIDFLVQKGSATEIEVANQLGIAKMISGSFLAITNKLRIEAHIVDVQSGVLEASDHVEGEQSDFFNLHRQLAVKVMAHLNIAATPAGETGGVPSPPSTPSLDTYKLLLEAEGETTATGPAKGDGPLSQGPLRKREDKLSHVPLGWEWTGASAAWAQESLQQGRISEEEIRQVLEKYRQAYEKKDLTLLDSVYDMLTPAQREANAKYFQQTQDLRVTIRDVDIAISGDEAAVSYTREDFFVDAKTGQNAKLAVRFTKFLVRTENTWKIASGKKEQWAPVKE
jgi:TolB-like protein/ketosteroid isomerase-like protein